MDWITMATAGAALLVAAGGWYATYSANKHNLKRLEYERAKAAEDSQRVNQDKVIEYLQKGLASQQIQLNAQQAQLDRKDTKIAALETRIEAMQVEHTETLERLRQVEQENVVLTEQVSILESKVKKLTDENNRLKGGRRKVGSE